MKTKENSNSSYHRAKAVHIAMATMSGAGGMIFYMLLSSATYIGNGNFGILVAVTGIIITITRLFDGVTDPIIALIVERFNSRFGKIRVFMLLGWAIMALSTTLMCNVGSRLGLTGATGTAYFIVCYLIYIIGYTFVGVTGNMQGSVMTNDPKQRPVISVWGTAYSYLTPMVTMMISSTVILPKYNYIQGPEYFNELNGFVVIASFVFFLLSAIGIAPYDKPENYKGLAANKNEKTSVRDMIALIKENKELQRFIIAAASDKLAQTITSASVVSTMLYGIWIGSITISTILSAVSMLPSIIFAIIGAKIAGKKGNLSTVINWTKVCIVLNVVYAAFLLFTPIEKVGGLMSGQASALALILAILFVLFNFTNNGFKMIVSVGTNALRMDIIDYELARTGKYMPATVSATYSFIDKLISSFGATIATAAVALIGYTTTAPQQGDPLTAGVKAVTIFLLVIFPILGWICTLVAEKKSELTYEKMADVQKEIADKKAGLIAAGSTK